MQLLALFTAGEGNHNFVRASHRCHIEKHELIVS
jgi:hypothetical protein